MRNRLLFLIGIIITGAILVACGGGGGGSSSSGGGASSSPTGLSGTASVGAAIASGVVTLTDVNGKSLQTSTDVNGAYSISDISSLTAPVLVSVLGTVGGQPITLSSVVTTVTVGGNNIANANPLTDAIVYQVAGKSPGNFLANPGAMSAITTSSVGTAVANISKAIAPVLNGISSGAASSGYSPISTAYVADGSNAYDKIYDLLTVYPASSVGSSNISINIADKSGTIGTVTLENGQSASSVSPLAPLPAAISSLNLSSIKTTINSFNLLASSSSGLNSSSFAALYSDGYLQNGMTKPQRLALITNPSESSYALGTTYSNVIVDRCDALSVCQVSFTSTKADKTTSTVTSSLIYDAPSSSWLFYGNRKPDLGIGFQSYALLSQSTGTFQIGINFGIHGTNESKANNPYNSATATFQDSSGNIDATINFIQKTSVGGSCAPSSSNYYGLPITDVSNPSSKTPDLLSSNACANWITITDETILKKINAKILLGGYQLVVKAYTTNNWTGTPVTYIDNLVIPLISSNVINNSMFPSVQTKSDSTGPYLYIPNGSDFTLIGSVCISSNTAIGYCDMTNQPNNTYVYNGSNIGLQNVYRPNPSWPSGQTIKTYFVHAQDKYGRDLRVGM